MIKFFRKLLIRIGKVSPFVLAVIVAAGYAENLYAMLNEQYEVLANGEVILFTPISNYLGSLVYIDWWDALILWVLCIALELCKYAFRCAKFLTLMLPMRYAVEHFALGNNTLIIISAIMALFGTYCVYGGFKVLSNIK